MTVNIAKATKEVLTVKEITPNMTFRLGGFWYLPISINDDCINNYEEFWEMHAETIPNYPNPTASFNGIPCFRVASASFVYIDGNLKVEDYGIPQLNIEIS